MDYVANQDISSCGKYSCPDGFVDIEESCYQSSHIDLLQSFIDSNASLEGLRPLELSSHGVHMKWVNGSLTRLILSGHDLTSVPEDICTFYPDFSMLDLSDNNICPPYPSCIDDMGYQETGDCVLDPCGEGYIYFDGDCYYYGDLQVLLDFTRINPGLENYHPLVLGYQVWKDQRLNLLNLDGIGIVNVPESIQKLEHLEYLNLNNNKLENLPKSMCEIYSHLIGVDLTNNLLCPPYLECFEYVGQQNTENCKHDFCPLGYKEYDEECYYQKDISVLQDFIDVNVSLTGRKPLEIGVQKWKNMHLDFLYLGVNELTVIPESICKIYSKLSAINISQNNLCPPYPACVTEIVGEQDTSECR